MRCWLSKWVVSGEDTLLGGWKMTIRICSEAFGKLSPDMT